MDKDKATTERDLLDGEQITYQDPTTEQSPEGDRE